MISPFDYFPLILCINQDHRTDRWADCLKEFEKVGISDRVERLSASQGLHPEHGCALSHVRAMRRMVGEGLSRILVLEDDVEFLPNWHEGISACLKDLGDRRCDALYLGAIGGRYVVESPDLLRVQGAMGTHAIMWTPKALEIVTGWYGNVEEWERPGPIDVVTSDHLVSLRHCYSPNPTMAIQRNSPSSQDDWRGHHMGHEMRDCTIQEWEQAVRNCPGVKPLVL